MKITSITARKVPLTSHETYYMADGKTCYTVDTVDTVVVRIGTDTNGPVRSKEHPRTSTYWAHQHCSWIDKT